MKVGKFLGLSKGKLVVKTDYGKLLTFFHFYVYIPKLRRVDMHSDDFKRKCDMCGSPYEMNNRYIPRIIVMKKIDMNDLTSKDFTAEPDYCDLCIKVILRLLTRKNELRFRIANRIFTQIESKR